MLPPLTLLRGIDTETKIIVQMIAFYVMFSTLSFISVSEIGTLFFVNYMCLLYCNLRRTPPCRGSGGGTPYNDLYRKAPLKGHLF